ncbi:MAG: 3'-5' exonuclease [Stenomitos rutilans HA7619-LM2]|jgi:DNA polymerase-3 subunit epsilon|nr:3'-5' exonuclease [Stenomitos rutilans HA7619-LM2]
MHTLPFCLSVFEALPVLSTDLLAFYRRVSQQSFTVVDVETTGHRASGGCRVIEVSVLHATLAEGILHQQTHLVNPQVPVPAMITRFTGIDQAMVDQASLAEEVWHSYLPLLNTGILTAHNLAFDYAFLCAEFDQLGIEFSRSPAEQLCTVILARLMLPDLPSRSLPDLVKHFQFPVGHSHRAEADTIACWLLAERLLTEVQNEPDEVLLKRFVQQWLPLGDAAALLGCSGKQARSRLEKAGVFPKFVGRHKTPMYQRGRVERVVLEQLEPIQLSWL